MITLGIDCGTQSTKVVALDTETGEQLAVASKSYGFVDGLPEGSMEQDPAWWTDAADSCTREILAQLGARKGDVKAIGVSGQQHGLVAIDDAGEVLRPAKLWCDTSTTAECAEITEALGGEDNAIKLVGNTIRTGYTAPKIRWLANHEPENYAKTRSILLPHDYLNFWLTGETSMEFGDASGTALMNVEDRQWCEEACRATAEGLVDKLPELKSSALPVGHVRSELLTQWGLAQSVLVSAGGGDNMMAAIGTGNVGEGNVTASLGTSGTLFAFSPDPAIDPKGEIAGFCDSTDHWLPLLCTMNVTLVTQHIREMFGWDFDQFDKAVSSVPAGGGGLTFLPYLTGERTPDLPNAKGAIAGLTLSNFTPAGLARASLDSVTLGLAYGVTRLRELGVSATSVRLTGGGSNSKVWRQICADAFGLPVIGLDGGAGAALGAAIQAAWTYAEAESGPTCLADICDNLVHADPAREASPEPSEAARYQDLLAEMNSLRTTLHSAGMLG